MQQTKSAEVVKLVPDRPKRAPIGTKWKPGHHVHRVSDEFWEVNRTGELMSSDELALQAALVARNAERNKRAFQERQAALLEKAKCK